MTLKTTLLMCEPMVTFDALFSCVIGPVKGSDHQRPQLALVCPFQLEPTYIVALTHYP